MTNCLLRIMMYPLDDALKVSVWNAKSIGHLIWAGEFRPGRRINYNISNRIVSKFKHTRFKIFRIFRFSNLNSGCQHDTKKHWKVSWFSPLTHNQNRWNPFYSRSDRSREYFFDLPVVSTKFLRASSAGETSHRLKANGEKTLILISNWKIKLLKKKVLKNRL